MAEINNQRKDYHHQPNPPATITLSTEAGKKFNIDVKHIEAVPGRAEDAKDLHNASQDVIDTAFDSERSFIEIDQVRHNNFEIVSALGFERISDMFWHHKALGPKVEDNFIKYNLDDNPSEILNQFYKAGFTAGVRKVRREIKYALDIG